MNKNQSLFLLILFGFISIVSCSPKKKEKSKNRTEIHTNNSNFKDPCSLLIAEPNFKMKYRKNSEISLYKPNAWTAQIPYDSTELILYDGKINSIEQLKKPFLAIYFYDDYSRFLYEKDALKNMFRNAKAKNITSVLLDSFRVKINSRDFLWLEYFNENKGEKLYWIVLRTNLGHSLVEFSYIERNRRPDINAYRIMNSIRITQPRTNN